MKKLIVALLFLSVFVTCSDNDKRKSVTGVTVSPAVISLSPEETAQLSIIISPENASDSSCSWVSGNTDAITVSETGLIKAIGYGTSEITVTTTDGGYTDSCTVTVPNYGPQFDTLTTNSSYTADRGWFSSYIYEGYIYVTGGSYSSSIMTSIEYATITDDGIIGSFSSASLPTGRAYHSCIAYKGYLYIVAGSDGIDMTNTVFYAPIISNGSPGTFQTATGSLNTARGGFGIAIVNDIMYVMGGTIGGNGTQSVEYATISANGDVGSFTEVATALNGSRSFCSAASYNGYLYVAGGRKTGSSSFDTVEYAKIENDGSVVTFTVASEICLEPREIFSITACNGYLYLAGGNNADPAESTSDTVEYAALASDTGAPGTFAYTTNKLPYTLMHHSVQAYRNRLYIIGGYGATKAIYSAPFLTP